MQGIFIGNSRPKSKKAIREAITSNPSNVYVEATSVFGNEFQGSITSLSDGQSVTFVGPDPYKKRNFYGSITKKGEKFLVK